MRSPARTQKRKAEPTIALINVVFLMLVFFLVAGALSPPMDDDVTLVSLAEIEGRQPPNAVMVHADGRATWRGEVIDPAQFDLPDAAQEEPGHIRILPDRDAPAARLLEVARLLRANGAEAIYVVTERGME